MSPCSYFVFVHLSGYFSTCLVNIKLTAVHVFDFVFDVFSLGLSRFFGLDASLSVVLDGM